MQRLLSRLEGLGWAEVVVELDAWFVGNALTAADQDDLLKDLINPPSR
jgi:hypothetical protein